MITVHHLGISQSERIVWLMEELELPYKLVKHDRAPALAPDSLKSIPGNETGKAPFIEDSEAGITLSESAAICDYINYTYGNGSLALKPGQENYPDYLYWFHYANGTLQAEMINNFFLDASGAPDDKMIIQFARQRMNAAWQQLDERLKNNKWLAGDEFTAADIMTVYCLTTQRYWGPQDDLRPYKNILRYLRDISARSAYQKAMKKGDPEMQILNGPEAPKLSLMESNGIQSDHWKKW